MAQYSVSITFAILIALISGCSVPTASPINPIYLTGEELVTLSDFGERSKFVFYLHGKIIEDNGINAVHPEFGPYEYIETLSYLSLSTAQVISSVRSAGTESDAYAGKVAGWITHLLDDGVQPHNISVVGFSKGAGIAILVSDQLMNPGINFVLIAVCSEEVLSNTDIRLAGRVLSLFETSDDLGGSCQDLAERSPNVSEFNEISFSTGEGHGAFYQAESFWLEAVIEWITYSD